MALSDETTRLSPLYPFPTDASDTEKSSGSGCFALTRIRFQSEAEVPPASPADCADVDEFDDAGLLEDTVSEDSTRLASSSEISDDSCEDTSIDSSEDSCITDEDDSGGFS